MDNIKIALTGACHSGKTTFMDRLKKIAPDDILLSSEIIRSMNIESIDYIRKDADKYFEFEVEIIRKKWENDRAVGVLEDKICLLDRSLIDSYFYFTAYIDPGRLNSENKIKYKEYLSKFEKKLFALNSFYDQIILFKPIPVKETDKFRPQNIEQIQQKEFETIALLYSKFDMFDKVKYFDSTSEKAIPDFINIIQEQEIEDSDFLSTYSKYQSFMEGKFLTFNHILMNTYGSVEYISQNRLTMLGSALLYTTNKQESDSIINDIKDIKISKDFMNSRCYPTGFYDKNNIMIVGEAPGQYGRSIKLKYLKPAFVFAAPSHILRSTIYKLFDKMPYITNLAKYAASKNNITSADFDFCKDIFLKEVNSLQPKLIIALGNSAFNYIQTLNLDIPVKKCLHPAYPLYKGIPLETYIEGFKECIK